MKKIKFRGEELMSGNILFGDLLHARGELLILEFGSKVARTVKKDSVAQLVGYDKNGKEIYEGDTVTDNYGHTLTAVMKSFGKLGKGGYFSWIPKGYEFKSVRREDYEED